MWSPKITDHMYIFEETKYVFYETNNSFYRFNIYNFNQPHLEKSTVTI